MSNPGVIQLFGFNYKINDVSHSFRVEDNIGEAIHFHFDNFRLDLTVKEFRAFADDMLDAITAAVNVEGFDARKQDLESLFRHANQLSFLREVRIEYMPVKNIIVDTLDKSGNVVYKYLKHSRVVKALRGDYAENDVHYQQNLIGQNNLQRLFSIFESVRKNGYPLNGELITLYNNQNIIHDGQHRAASIYVLNPEAVVPIQRWIFYNNAFSVPNPVFDLS
ncbi:MAG: hypothetical protein II857_06285 [Selenomonadaceae bacterium]|nr:hypothetical protein [Selenomonadaceae bacterium]